MVEKVWRNKGTQVALTLDDILAVEGAAIEDAGQAVRVPRMKPPEPLPESLGRAFVSGDIKDPNASISSNPAAEFTLEELRRLAASDGVEMSPVPLSFEPSQNHGERLQSEKIHWTFADLKDAAKFDPETHDLDAYWPKTVVRVSRDRNPDLEVLVKHWEFFCREKQEEEKRFREHQEVYKPLFQFQQQLSSGGAASDFVVGFCRVAANLDGTEFDYPLITRRLRVENDQESLVLRLDEDDPRNETHRLEQADWASQGDLAGVIEGVIEENSERFGFDLKFVDIEPVLKAVSGKVHADAQTAESLKEHKADHPAPAVTADILVFSRKRSTEVLVDDAKKLLRQIEAAKDDSPLMRAVIDGPSDSGRENDAPTIFEGFAGDSLMGGRRDGSAYQRSRLYFPRPYNEEQIEIVRHIEREGSLGAIVQGPPGTGKTHTISNIISDQLARGRRVLVTSEKESALSALRKHLPVGIQALAMSRIENEGGIKEMESAFNAINEKLVHYRKNVEAEKIDQTQDKISGFHEQLRLLDKKLAAFHRGHNEPIRISSGKRQMEWGNVLEARQWLIKTPAVPEGWITPVEAADDSVQVEPSFPTTEDADHGTRMAGLAGELQPACLAIAKALTDVMKADPLGFPIALSDGELEQLLVLRRDLMSVIAAGNVISLASRPAPASLMPPAELESLAHQHAENQAPDLAEQVRAIDAQIEEQSKAVPGGAVDGSSEEVQDAINKAKASVEALAKASAVTPHRKVADTLTPGGRLHDLLESVSPGSDAESLAEWLKSAEKVDALYDEIEPFDVQLPSSEGAFTAKFIEIVSKAAMQGKKPGLIGMLAVDKSTKSALSQLTVQGVEPSTKQQWKAVERAIEFRQEARRVSRNLVRRVNEAMGREPDWAVAFTGKESDIDRLDSLLDGYRNDIKLVVETAAILGDMVKPCRQVMPSVDVGSMSNVLSAVLSLSEMHEVADLRSERDRLNGEIEQAERSKQEIEASLRGALKAIDKERRHLPSDKSITACHDALGNILSQIRQSARVAREDLDSLLDRYVEAHSDYEVFRASYKSATAYQALVQKLRQEGFATLADFLVSPKNASPVETGLDALLAFETPRAFRAFHEWIRVEAAVESVPKADEFETLQVKRHAVESQLEDAYLALIEQRAWQGLAENITPAAKSQMTMALQAMKRLPKGKTETKSAPRRRREARKAMQRAYKAIPCWIMSHYWVSDVMPSVLEDFDLVVVDEASQSSAWGLLPLLRAKKILIVGDDKQVSPLSVGMREETIGRLEREYLGDVESGSMLLPGNSLYDLGSVILSDNLVRLREHFRCVRPIIDFSSQHFYDDKIIPLRVPKPSERVDPPLVSVEVKMASEDRGGRNEAEVDAMIAELRSIEAEPSMKDKTIGILVFGGGAKTENQIKLVLNRVLEELGEDFIHRRDLHVGGASDFQGREADIMLIGFRVVASENGTVRKLHENDDNARKINVTASRAKDQMIVFHSFPRTAMNPADWRARLLDYMETAQRSAPNMARADMREKCESSFEERFYDEITRRGYRVTPQVPVGAYRIDMVIEGGNDKRLAVELDGDKYHRGREKEDAQRQRNLERAGWEFWRCWGSDFAADPHKQIQHLGQVLKQMGIEPVSEDEGVDERPVYERRVFVHSEGAVSRDNDRQEDLFDAAEVAAEDQRSEEPNGAPAFTVTEVDSAEREASATAGPAKNTGVDDEQTVEVGKTVYYAMRKAGSDDETVGSMQIIASGASDVSIGVINQNAPLAATLLGASAGEEVGYRSPDGQQKIIRVERII